MIQLRLSLLALFSLFALTAVFAAGGMGTISGTVALDDGTLCRQMPVIVHSVGGDDRLVTDEAGAFRASVPAGAVTVSCRGAQSAMTVAAGETQHAALIIHPTGVLLSVVVEHGPAPLGFSVAGAFRAPAGAKSDLPGVQISDTIFWIPDVPANASALAAVVSFTGRYTPAWQRAQWSFTTPSPLRRLRLALSFAPLTVQVTGANQAPLANAAVSGLLECAFPRKDDFWTPEHALPLRPLSTITQAVTDAQGLLTLGPVPAQRYTLALTVAGQTGAPTTITVAADGTLTPRSYAVVWQPRQLTQTIRRTDGTLAANAEVNAAYAWDGKITTLHVKTNEQGLVHWDNLPPASLATWGPGLAPALFPADAAGKVAAPPAPAPHEPMSIHFRLTGLGESATAVLWIWDNGRQQQSVSRSYDPAHMSGAMLQSIDVTPGVPFTIAAMTTSTPPRIALYRAMCAPEIFASDSPVWELSFQGGVQLHGVLRDAAGAPVRNVSRLTLLPMTIPDLEPVLEEHALAMQPVVQQHDGTFEAAVLLPGVYRLLVDLDTASQPPLPGTLFTLQTGENSLMVTLPEPLATPPMDAVVHWITRNAPRETHTLRAARGLPEQPIYGSSDEIPALWYLEDQDTLVVREAVPGKPPVIRKAVCREVSLSVLDAQGHPYAEALSLASLFPTLPIVPDEDLPGDLAYKETTLSPGKAETSTTLTNLNLGRATHLSVWPGRYIIVDRDVPPHMVAQVDIPANGPADITVQGTPAPRLPSECPVMTIHLRIPAAPSASAAASPSLSITSDVPLHNPRLREGQQISGGLAGQLITANLDVPTGARHLTVSWPGVGVMRDVPLPADVKAPFALPAWQPGLTVSGVIHHADGTPLAKTKIYLGAHAGVLYHDTVPVVTDNAGHFSVSGLLPGTLFITVTGGIGWIRTLPATGIGPLDLCIPAQPISWLVTTKRPYTQYWWIPAQGKARQVFGYAGNYCADLEITAGKGWLWALTPIFDYATCLPITAHPNTKGPQAEDGSIRPVPSLGLTFPLDLRVGLPGMVTLDGRGALAGIHVEFPAFRWHPCAELGLALGQLDALPPGDYRVTVETTVGNIVHDVTVGEYGAEVKDEG